MFRFISLVDPAPSTAASLLPSFPMLKASVIFHWPLRPPRIKTTFPRLPQLGILIWRSSGQWDIIQDITWQFWVPPFQNNCGHNHGGLRVTSWSKCQSSGTLRKLHHTDFTENCYASCRPPISDRFWDRGHLWLILGLCVTLQPKCRFDRNLGFPHRKMHQILVPAGCHWVLSWPWFEQVWLCLPLWLPQRHCWVTGGMTVTMWTGDQAARRTRSKVLHERERSFEPQWWVWKGAANSLTSVLERDGCESVLLGCRPCFCDWRYPHRAWQKWCWMTCKTTWGKASLSFETVIPETQWPYCEEAKQILGMPQNATYGILIYKSS